MVWRPRVFLAVGVLFAVLVGGWLVPVPAQNPVYAGKADTPETEAAGILDGMTFASELGPLGKPANVEDSLIFQDGMFVSRECERRCGYPPAPYFVRRVGDKFEFISETHCQGKDSTIVWRGTVDGRTIKGTYTWTAERWYWAIEKEFWFEGRLAFRDIPVASER